MLDNVFLEMQNEICAVSGYAFLAELRFPKGCHQGVAIGEIFAKVALSGGRGRTNKISLPEPEGKIKLELKLEPD